MTIYTVTFRSATRWAEETIQARTPKAALAKARKAFADDPYALDWDTYAHDGIELLEEVVVSNEAGRELTAWISEDCRQSLAAPDLLAAAEMALERLRLNDCQGEERKFIAVLETAIAKAKGEPAPGLNGGEP